MTVNVSEWSAAQLRNDARGLRTESPAGEQPVAFQQVAPGSSGTFSAKTQVVVVVSDAPVLVGVDVPTATVYLDPYERRVFAVKPGGNLVTLAAPTPAPEAATVAPAPAAATASAATAPAA